MLEHSSPDFKLRAVEYSRFLEVKASNEWRTQFDLMSDEVRTAFYFEAQRACQSGLFGEEGFASRLSSPRESFDKAMELVLSPKVSETRVAPSCAGHSPSTVITEGLPQSDGCPAPDGGRHPAGPDDRWHLPGGNAKAPTVSSSMDGKAGGDVDREVKP
ncbi:hypothetical protein [Paraburkholderia terrae]